MNHQGRRDNSHTTKRIGAGHAFARCALGLLLAGVTQFIGARELGSELAFDQQLSSKLAIYANLLLLVATALYVAHLWIVDQVVGVWATTLALLGALGLLASLLLQWTEAFASQRGSHAPLTRLNEVMVLFSALTVLLYLAMERAYRSRSAGAFVMPIVALAALFEVSLLSGEQVASAGAAPVLNSYLVRAHVFSNFLGYGAFAVAAAMAAMDLLRARAERSAAASALRALPAGARLMHLAIGLGFPLFSLGIVLGMRSAHLAWGRYWAWDTKECWALLVWCMYAAYFLLHYAAHWRGARMAWLVLGCFSLTAFGFLGLQWRGAGLHAYG